MRSSVSPRLLALFLAAMAASVLAAMAALPLFQQAGFCRRQPPLPSTLLVEQAPAGADAANEADEAPPARSSTIVLANDAAGPGRPRWPATACGTSPPRCQAARFAADRSSLSVAVRARNGLCSSSCGFVAMGRKVITCRSQSKYFSTFRLRSAVNDFTAHG